MPDNKIKKMPIFFLTKKTFIVLLTGLSLLLKIKKCTHVAQSIEHPNFYAWMAQSVEHVLGKDEVMGSIPIPGL